MASNAAIAEKTRMASLVLYVFIMCRWLILLTVSHIKAHAQMPPNAPAHRRRADDVRLSTETQSRRSVQPVCSAICMSFSFQASHILPSAHGVSFGAPSLSSVGFLKLDAESERRGVTQFNPGTEVAMKPLSLHRSIFLKHP